MFFLYDPRTNISSETDMSYLEELTGLSYDTLYYYRRKQTKIRSIGCYLTKEKATVTQRKEWYVNETYQDEAWKEINGSNGQFLISSYGRF